MYLSHNVICPIYPKSTSIILNVVAYLWCAIAILSSNYPAHQSCCDFIAPGILPLGTPPLARYAEDYTCL